MKKIGKEVFFLSTAKDNPRNGEGCFLHTKNGQIMFVFTQYCGDSWGDHATARVAVIYSADQGITWTAPKVLVEKGNDDLNIMSLSLLRMANGDLGLIYLRKFMKGEKLLCMPFLIRSSDEGTTFSAPLSLLKEDGYYVVNNDRLIRLKNGRILLPISGHGNSGVNLQPGYFFACYSDDDGKTWQLSRDEVHSPYQDNTQLQEPGLFELPDGRVWMYCRTAYGHQYQSFSSDGGDTWGAIMPCFRFTSPDAPMLVKQAGKYTLAVYNPLGYTCLRKDTEIWGSPKRTPYVCAISTNGGLSFVDMTKTFQGGGFQDFTQNCYLLEDDTTNSYCYPTVIALDDGFLVAYYHSNGTDICLNSTKITKVSFDELDGATTR